MKSARLNRFFAALLLALLGATRPASANPLETPDQVLRYLVAHRADISLVSYTVTPAGTPDPADPVIRVNAFRVDDQDRRPRRLCPRGRRRPDRSPGAREPGS